MDFVTDIFAKGGPVMWPLLLCSLISVTITVERVIFWWRSTLKRRDETLQQVFELTESGRYDAVLDLGKECNDPAVRMVVYGLTHRDHGLGEAMEVEAGDEIARMKHGLTILDTVITMAPMLGILGTVTGIIKCFNLLGESGVQDPRAATTGLAEALITTAAGLIIALLTLVPFNSFVARVQRETRRLEQIGTQFHVIYRKSRGARI